MGTIKTTNIETITGSGTLTLGQSGETITVPTGATISGALANTPAFVLTNSGNQSVSIATWTQLTFDTTALDTDSAVSSSTFTVPSGKGGTYMFFWGIHGIQGLDATEFVQLRIYVNNVPSNFSDNRMTSDVTNAEFKFSTNFQAVLSAGDTVGAYVYQNEGASQNVTNAHFSGFKLIGA